MTQTTGPVFITPWAARVTPAGWLNRLRETPFVVGYLAVAWLIFAVLAAIDFPNRRELADPFGVAAPRQLGDIPHALLKLGIAPLVNAGIAQLLYVTVLLWIVGRRLERALSPGRVAAVFVVSTWAGGLVAATLLYLSELWQPGLLDGIFDEAWERRWNGGSAGCYGLVAVAIAWSSRPVLGVGAVISWELGLAFLHLQSLTPAFHLGALASGLLMARRSMANATALSPPSHDSTP